ncbi:MAG: hypothetical protein KDD42_03825 [Bdellovibrionales bacterium]|nr:hypothetical protein [Bdellovibrionales bacterium]
MFSQHTSSSSFGSKTALGSTDFGRVSSFPEFPRHSFIPDSNHTATALILLVFAFWGVGALLSGLSSRPEVLRTQISSSTSSSASKDSLEVSNQRSAKELLLLGALLQIRTTDN